jgi:hypothetical protein
MPKSRKRRTKQGKRRSSPKRRNDPWSCMTADELMRNLAVLRATDDAERRGDARAALDLMEEHPGGFGFWRPWRVRALLQMAIFGSLLPPWATSRWILAQAGQQLPDQRGGLESRRVQRALELAVELRGGRASLPGGDPRDALCKVMDHDWVFRQLHLYEFGGLRYFLGRRASADLVSGADRIQEWAAAPMGGFRFLGSQSATVTWVDLAVGEPVVTPNIGSAVLVEPGECVIGRLVPIEGGAMFEGAPLVVPEAVAVRVARDPASWIDALRPASEGTAGPEVAAAGDTSGLLSDVPMAVWMYAVTDGGGLADATSAPSSVQLAKASLNLARAALERSGQPDKDGLDPWGCLSAAVLSPSVAAALAETVGPADREVLVRLGERLAEPAASWCNELADSLTQVA